MTLTGPPPLRTTNPLVRLRDDVRAGRAADGPFPPGDTSFSLVRTLAVKRDPLALLLDAYARHGPVFTLRLFHQRVVWLLGPQANHHVTVTGADALSWRGGYFGELLPLLGDGLLTIDGDFHRRSRRIVLPAMHRERLVAAHATMADEAGRAVERLRPGARLDLFAWTRALALRIALRALFGVALAPGHAERLATAFERALGFWGLDYHLQLLRGPGTPWARMVAARGELDRLVLGEIARRRRTGERGGDVLSLLLDAEDQDGSRLSDRHVRDEVVTLLFAGHDTTASAVAFLVFELARAPGVLARVQAERDRVLGPRDPTAAELLDPGTLPELERALEEALRLWPPAWIAPRRAVRAFVLHGVRIPAGAPVALSSWATHRLPDVWEQPDAFRPERFTPEARARLPKGAYMPFGAGSRTCIGMRFGQLEIRELVTRLLRDFTLRLEPGFRLTLRQAPTLAPRAGLPVRLVARGG